MKIEQNYDFRKELLTIHEANVRDLERKPLAGEFFFADAINAQSTNVIFNEGIQFFDNV